jgi:hypothetical protein
VAIKDIRDSLKRLKDADPVEIASQVNGWIQDSGEAIRLRVEDEVEKAVTKRGFVKRSEFQKLEARITALEGKPKSSSKKSDAKGSPKSSTKKSVKKSVKTKAKGKK